MKRLFRSECLPLLAVYGILLSYCTPDLLFSDTMLTGGDSVSWLQPIEHLRNVLLPQGRISGWSLSNFFGYSEGQYYFPLPFVTGALLSYAIPVTIALKVVTLAGVFGLPLAFVYCARQLVTNRWVQWAAPGLALLFLCNESYTMFGGNLLSTLAGEFCYSWAIAWFVLFIGATWKALFREGSPVFAGVLLALIALSHTFVFLVAFLLPFFAAFGKEEHRGQTASRLLVIYGVGLAGSALWLLPMALSRVWASTIPMFWNFSSVSEFLSQTRFPILALGAAVCLGALALPAFRRLGAFLLYGLGSCAFFFFCSSFLEVPDIRFVPPALVLSALALLLAADMAAALTRPWFARWSFPLRGALPAAAFYALVWLAVAQEAKNLGGWFRWNYTGVEAKAQAPLLGPLKTQFGGDSSLGRLLWEKPDQRDSADFGSERIFENLSHFTGRGTSEGIHYGSSFMARATTYLQSEYSLNPVDAEPNRIYSAVNPEAWPIRFAQVNAKDIIVFSDTVKRLFEGHHEFQKTADYGKFAVFTYQAFPARYTEVLPPASLTLIQDSTAGFKTDFYRYFRDYELIRHPFVPASFADPFLRERVPFLGTYDELLTQYQNSGDFRGWSPETAAITDEAVHDLTIAWTTTAVGKPHLIKVTYSPQFVSEGGERIYPVAPGFMLMYPSQSQVRIHFERSVWDWAGLSLTLLTLPVGFWISRRQIGAFPWPRLFQWIAFPVFFSGAALVLVFSFGGTRQVMAAYDAAAGLAFHSPEANGRALELLDPLTTPAVVERYDNQLTANALILKARLLTALERGDDALPLYQTLRFRYRHSRLLESIQNEGR